MASQPRSLALFTGRGTGCGATRSDTVRGAAGADVPRTTIARTARDASAVRHRFEPQAEERRDCLGRQFRVALRRLEQRRRLRPDLDVVELPADRRDLAVLRG